MNYWLVKSPFQNRSWSYVLLQGVFKLYGIRNRQARNYIVQMTTDDKVVYYHSAADRMVFGIMRVKAPAFPDPTSSNPEWMSIKFMPEITFEQPILLEQLKDSESLRELKLFKQPRLSVMPLTKAEYLAIQQLSVHGG
jgi:predicted RNA-binding protein with PUA-like domain